jgi:hypothetical protein
MASFFFEYLIGFEETTLWFYAVQHGYPETHQSQEPRWYHFKHTMSRNYKKHAERIQFASAIVASLSFLLRAMQEHLMLVT